MAASLQIPILRLRVAQLDLSDLAAVFLFPTGGRSSRMLAMSSCSSSSELDGPGVRTQPAGRGRRPRAQAGSQGDGGEQGSQFLRGLSVESNRVADGLQMWALLVG